MDVKGINKAFIWQAIAQGWILRLSFRAQK